MNQNHASPHQQLLTKEAATATARALSKDLEDFDRELMKKSREQVIVERM